MTRCTSLMPSSSRSSSRLRVSNGLPATSSSTFGIVMLRGWTRVPRPAAAIAAMRGAGMTEAYEAPRPRAKRAARGGSSGQARATSSGVSTRRFLLLAAAVGLLVGVVLTWPLVLHLGSAVLEDGSLDAFQFTWNVWWVGESLLHLHRHPFATHYLYYPDGIPLLFHTGSFALGLLSLPLQLLAGVVVAHNVLVVTAPALTLVAVALLAREPTGDAWAPSAAGLLGAITPYSVWALPVIYMSCGWIPPALLWLWWLLQRRREWRLVAATFASLSFSVFASQEYAM